MTIWFVGTGILLCVLLSAFFSASEMSYSSCNTVRLENEEKDGNKKAKRALFIADHFDDALSAILIGNNLVNIAASSLCSVFVILATGEDKLTWVATIIITIAIIIFGETIPKITAKQRANGFAMFASAPLRFLMIIFKPIIWIVVKLINLITMKMNPEEDKDEDEGTTELQSIIETAEDEGVLDKERTELIHAAIDFSEISAFEVMTARIDVDAIDIDDDKEDILEVVRNTSHTRIPVYENGIDHIIGIVHMNHFLKAMANEEEMDLRSILMKPCFVYKTTKLPAVLEELRKAKQHLAIVTDEYGGTLGVISMEDVLEQIVGDIWDDTDDIEVDVVRHSENEIEVDGDMVISDFLDLTDIDEDELECESDTLGGFITETLGTFPEEGDHVDFKNLTLTVLKMDERRVEKVLIRFN